MTASCINSCPPKGGRGNGYSFKEKMKKEIIDMKEYFADKKTGFYVTLAAALISIITLIVYAVGYGRTRYMSWEAFWIVLIGIVVAAALVALKLYRFAPAVLFGANTLALCFFAYHIYFFVSSVVYGIQFSAFPPEFIASVVMFVLAIISSIVAIFMKQTDGKGDRL